ncbi:PKHD-type hydroxylase [Breoghania corrubedonensis]|uniref:PKHD-type hydroxylase n=1 Tax=Breoghania corrubedonensis TaxID=665038 RepID=A0A2T5VES9_9HYPH|nr:2OG-Fe(II) oxygenase [Breoghania corrubedonensis]PTW62236.1 PKHD-type hydroxylase [Breoghania corrubedonensis]
MFTHSISGLFSSSEAQEVIRLSQRAQAASGGLVGGLHHHNIRRATIAWLDDGADAAWVMTRIVEGVARANRDCFGFDIAEFKERLQVATYDESDTGHYDWHSDIGEGPLARHRKLTIVVQLSEGEGYEGGALEINLGGTMLSAAREAGEAMLFASFMLHRVTPVTRGRRYSLTCWSHGPQFR